jgi:hypothetical protein
VTVLATLRAEWAALTASPTVDRALDVLRADPALAVPDLPALLVATRTPLTRSATTCALLGAADPTTPAGRIATRVLVQAYLPAVAAMARDRRLGADPGERCSTALTGLPEAIAAARCRTDPPPATPPPAARPCLSATPGQLCPRFRPTSATRPPRTTRSPGSSSPTCSTAPSPRGGSAGWPARCWWPPTSTTTPRRRRRRPAPARLRRRAALPPPRRTRAPRRRLTGQHNA